MSFAEKLGELDDETAQLVSLITAIVVHHMALGMTAAQIASALQTLADPAFMRLVVRATPTLEAGGRLFADLVTEEIDEDPEAGDRH